MAFVRACIAALRALVHRYMIRRHYRIFQSHGVLYLEHPHEPYRPGARPHPVTDRVYDLLVRLKEDGHPVQVINCLTADKYAGLTAFCMMPTVLRQAKVLIQGVTVDAVATTAQLDQLCAHGAWYQVGFTSPCIWLFSRTTADTQQYLLVRGSNVVLKGKLRSYRPAFAYQPAFSHSSDDARQLGLDLVVSMAALLPIYVDQEYLIERGVPRPFLTALQLQLHGDDWANQETTGTITLSPSYTIVNLSCDYESGG